MGRVLILGSSLFFGLSSSDLTPLALGQPAASDALGKPTDADLAKARLAKAEIDPQAREAIAQLLAAPHEASGVTPAILNQISMSDLPPAWALRPTMQGLRSTPWEFRGPGIAAISSYSSREAAEFLVGQLADAPAERKGMVVQALTRLSGRLDMGTDHAAWQKWIREAQPMPEVDWLASLSRWRRERSDGLQRERSALVDRLKDVSTRLYLATPSAQRSALIAGLIADPLNELRDLGLDLLERELGETRRFDAAVEQSLEALISSPDPVVRERSVSLIGRVATGNISAKVLAALEHESEPSVAAALLRIAARWPGEALLAPAMRWAGAEPPASDAAAEAAWAVAKAGWMDDDSRARLIQIERATPLNQLRPAGCFLLASFGTDADRARLGNALADALDDLPSPSTRQAAAEALAGYPEHVDDLLAAAGQDPALFTTASRTVLMHRATSDGFAQLAALPAPSTEIRRAELLGLARALPSEDLLAVVALVPDEDLQWQESLLAHFASEDRRLSEQYSPEQFDALCDGVLLLAELRVRIGKPDAALAAIEACKNIDKEVDPLRLARVRTISMIWINRLDLAAQVPAGADAWLEGLKAILELPHATQVASTIRSRFADSLSPEESSELDRLTGQIRVRVDGSAAPSKTPK